MKLLPRLSLALRTWRRALRPHQWAKNALLVLPILAAHVTWTFGLLLTVAAGFTSFSLLASAGYLINDVADLRSDQSHPSKQDRPLAAGDLSIRASICVAVLLLGASALLALQLSEKFTLALGVYLAINLGYSGGLKQLPALDVVILAALYTIRVVAGAALVEVPLTNWFLAFSIFFFLSLAILKRVVELARAHASGRAPELSRRPYGTEDLAVLQSVGPAAGVMSALVYCLYITGPVRELYSHPLMLWTGLPLLLYWILRVWILAIRGRVEEDPVVFVLGDIPSYLVLLAFLFVVYLAV